MKRDKSKKCFLFLCVLNIYFSYSQQGVFSLSDDYIVKKYSQRWELDSIDQHGKAQRIGQKDKLLPFGAANLAGLGQEIDAVVPLLLGQMHFLGKGMQVLDQRGHHNRQTRVDIRPHAVIDGLNRAFFGEILGHGGVLLRNA